MKITLSLEEVREIIKADIFRRCPSLGSPQTVSFIHNYSDGSGEAEIEDVYPIYLVEVGFEEALPALATTPTLFPLQPADEETPF